MLRLILAVSLLIGVFAQVPVPDNDRCVQSVLLEPYVPVNGTNTGANFDYNNQGVCGPRSDRIAVWFEVRGRDADVTVKLCSNNNVITDFGVFTECNSKLCQGAPPQFFEAADCALDQSVDFTWFAESGGQYYVHVRSDVTDGIGSNFTIVYEDDSLDGPVTDAPTRAPTEEDGVGSALSLTSLVGAALFTTFLL